MGICYHTLHLFFHLFFSLWPTGYVSPAHGDRCTALKLNKTSSKLCPRPTKLVAFVLKAVCSPTYAVSLAGFVFFGAESNQMFLFEPLKLIAHDAVSFFTAVSPRSTQHPHNASFSASGINTYFKVIFSESNFSACGWHLLNCLKAIFQKAKPCVGGFGCEWGKCESKGGRDQYDFESNNITVIPAVCLQQTQN